MTHPPTTQLVGEGWLRLAAPGVRVGRRLPAVDEALRTDGFIRTQTVGGSPDRYTPMRNPVVVAECWAAAAASGVQRQPWNRAESLAEQVIAATADRSLMGRVIDLSAVGDYSNALLRTVVALNEPRPVEDPSTEFARFDIDLLLAWTTT